MKRGAFVFIQRDASLWSMYRRLSNKKQYSDEANGHTPGPTNSLKERSVRKGWEKVTPQEFLTFIFSRF
jgi:hypothetical protein